MINLLVIASIVIIPFIVPILSYSALCGLVVESIVSERSRDWNLLRMAQSMEQSTLAQSESLKDQQLADELEEQSVSEATESEENLSQSVLLSKKSEAEEAKALKDEKMSETFFEKASEEKAEAVEAETNAAEEEGIYEADMAEGDAEAAEAAEDEASGEATGLASVFCNFIPFMDLVCDAVGAAAEVGLKSAEAVSAAASIASYAAASSAKSQEEADLAYAAKEQALVKTDTTTANKYKVQAAREKELAEKYEMESKKDELKYKEELSKSETDEAESAVKESQSAKEEEESAASFGRAIKFGMAATGDALMSILSTLPVLFFFSARVGTQAIVPSVSFIHGHVTSHGFRRGTVTMWSSMQKNVVRMAIHCHLFISSLWIQEQIDSTWKTFNAYSITQKGGTIIIFAVLTGCLHAAVFTYLDLCKDLQNFLYFRNIMNVASRTLNEGAHSLGMTSKHIAFRFFLMLCFYVPLLVIEVLILLVFNDGDKGVMSKLVSISGFYFIGLLILILAVCMIELYAQFMSKNNEKTEKKDYSDINDILRDDSMELISQTDLELPQDTILCHTREKRFDGETNYLLTEQMNQYEGKDDSFETLSLDQEKNKTISKEPPSSEFKNTLIALELPFSILLLTIAVTVFQRHAIITWTALKPVLHHVSEKLIDKVGTGVKAYAFVSVCGIFCIFFIIFWTRTVHRNHTNRSGYRE